MPKIEGYPEIVRGLNAAFDRYGKAGKITVQVGFDAHYAGLVHERLDIPHAPPTQAKFLETPARENAQVYQNMIEQAVLGGQTLVQALLAAAVQLQADAVALCPIDTGFLRRSAYTQVEESR